MSHIIVIVGSHAAGKTTLGMNLSRTLDATFLDFDTLAGPVIDAILTDSGHQAGHYDVPIARRYEHAGYAALERTAAVNHALGRNVVIAAPYEDRRHKDWYSKLVLSLGAEPLVVWLNIDGVDAPASPHVNLDARLTAAAQEQIVLSFEEQ